MPRSTSLFRAGALGSMLVAVLASTSVLAAPPEDRGRPLGRGAEVYGPVTPHLTRRASDAPRTPSWRPGDAIREVPRRVFPVPDGKQTTPEPGQPDPLLELRAPQRAPSIIVDVNIAGSGYSGATPPDTVGDVGPNHYVQAVNASTIRIFDKAGVLVAGPFELDSLAPAGDSCATGSGDPIVLYDRLADRWFLQEFRTGTNRLCIYISQTSDPTGAYHFYGFNSPTFPDYPHFGIFPQGYFAGTNENGSGGNQTTYAFDRARMLAGQPASMQRLVVVPPLSGYGFQMLTPADLDGANPPPAGTGGLFMRHFDRQAHSSPASPTDLLQMYEMHVDWNTPANTVLTALPSIPIAEFNSWFVDYTTFYSVPQPNTGTLLDPIREAILNRLVYRNFGTHETLLGNFASNRNPATSGSTVSAGIRWFELRRVGGPGNPWTLHQEGTFGGDSNSPTAQYFMGGIAMDGAGNIGLGYSKTNTSPAVFPSIGVTGRLAGDAPGTMGPEVPVVSGVQSQTSSGRWGDYANMSIDPVDDCTFWYTNEYMPGGGSWGTRIVSFRFEECLGGFTLAPAPAAIEACALVDPEVSFDIAVTGLQDYADGVTLAADALPPGTSAGFAPNGVVPDFTSVLTISDLDQSVTGDYTIQVTGTGSDPESTVRATAVQLRLAVAGAEVPAQLAPPHGAVGVALAPTLSWTPAAEATGYVVEVASDIDFTTIVHSATVTGTSHVVATPLAPTTQYFWRVRGTNACGAGVDSPVRHFSTVSQLCVTPGLPIPDNNAAGVNSQIVVTAGTTLTDLDVEFEARHTWIGDLIVTLNRGPTTVTLMDRPGVPTTANGCSGDNPNIIFDDASPNPVETSCVNANPGYPIGGRFSPNQALAAFNGSSAAGTWTLNVSDRAGLDTGFLDRWCLVPSPSNSLAAFNDYYTMNAGEVLVMAAPGVMANDAGNNLTAALLAGPGDGNLLFDPDGGFEYAPDAGFCGNDAFSYSITDGSGTSNATVTITVDCTNQPPVIADQAFAVDENSPLGTVVGTVVATDADPGAVLVFAVTGGSGETAFELDPDSGEITVADPAQLDFEANASLTLEVTVTDGVLAAGATITIDINDVNEAPVAGPLDDQVATETLPFSFDASVAFSDPEGDPLTFSAQGLPDSLTIDADTGVISGTPGADEVGVHAVVVTASDGEFEADAGFELTVVAFEPLIFRDGFEPQN